MQHTEIRARNATTMPPQVAKFLDSLPTAPGRVLLTDYDGTLAPFRNERLAAVPYPAVPALLQRVRSQCDTRVIVVTGRRAREAQALLGINGIEIWGCHGIEHLSANGSSTSADLDSEVAVLLARANDLLESEGLHDRLEYKLGSTAVHWRGLTRATAAETAHAVKRVWRSLPSRRGLQLLAFDGGLEIRARSANKGSVIQQVLAHQPSSAAIAYLGDDITDEDAFSTLKGRGLGVLVAGEFRPTVADAWLQPPEGLAQFLLAWANACGSKQ